MNMINAPHTITTESNQDITIMRRATEILNKDKAKEGEGGRAGKKGPQRTLPQLSALSFFTSSVQFGLSRITYEA